MIDSNESGGPGTSSTPIIRSSRSGGRAARAMLFGLIVSSATGSAAAREPGDERFSLSLGLFITDRETETRIDAESGAPGSDVDLETDLGLDSSDSVFRIDGYYKFNEKHRIDASWFDLSRTSVKEIDREIEWNGTVFPIDTTINSIFDLDIYKVAYTWSFLRREKGFLGATAGLYIADFATSLDAPSIGQREVGEATAPLPVFGLRGEYRFTDRWTFRASGELFVFEYDNWDGSLYDLYAGIDYGFTDNFALGVAVNSVTFDIGVSESNFNGEVDWGYLGGLVFLKVGF